MQLSNYMNSKRLFLVIASVALTACVSQQTLVAGTPSGALSYKTTKLHDDSKTVLANTKTVLSHMFDLNPDCSVRETPTVHITQQPTHGTLVVVAVNDYPAFIATNVRAACNKQKVAGQQAEYTPEKDFKGTDLVAYEVFTSSGQVGSYKFTLTVE